MATEYHAVDTSPSGEGCWSPFLKQLHLSTAVWILYFMNGLSTGAPTVFIPQIRKEWNTTETIDDELASWIYSAPNLAALPWLLFVPAFSQLVGRKIPCLLCAITMTLLFTLLYFSSTTYHILIAEGIQGFVNAFAISTIIHVIPEYCNHRYRSIFINIQSTTHSWGMWVSNAIGTFFHWKYIAIVGFICSFYSFSISFYPESPRWLASKGRSQECEEAHRWLRGSNPEAKKELQNLIKSQVDPRKGHGMSCSELLNTLTCKQFYMPLLLVVLIGAQYNFSGKLVCSIYAIDIFKKITKSEGAAYRGMLILDGMSVLGMYIGSFLSKIVKLRVLYFSLSFLSIGVMFTFSLYLYLAKLSVIKENDMIALGFLVIYSLGISSGPVVLSYNFYSELISIKYQAISYPIVSLSLAGLCTGMLKFTPMVLSAVGLHGTFLFYGISCGITTILLYVYLPETKNKTLDEIEDWFKNTAPFPEAEALTTTINPKCSV